MNIEPDRTLSQSPLTFKKGYFTGNVNNKNTIEDSTRVGKITSVFGHINKLGCAHVCILILDGRLWKMLLHQVVTINL